MKILMVLESEFPPDIRVENEIKTLHNAGHEVDIACYSRTSKSTFEKTENCTIHRKRINAFIYKSSIGALKFNFYFSFWKNFLTNLLSKKKYDVLHIHDLTLVKIGLTLKRKFDLRLIIDLHENWPALLQLSEHTKTIAGKILCSIPEWIKYERRYIPLVDDIIVVIDEAKERIAQFGVDKSKIHVVSNTLEVSMFSFPQPKKEDNKFLLVYGGGVNYHRGLQNVISAFPELIKKIPHIELWVIGAGRYLEKLKDLAKVLGVEEHIVFYGWKKQQELLQLVSQAHVAVIPHIKSDHTDNTIPHKLFQYMYAGIPILASNCNPITRIVNETKSGLIYKDSDINDFIDKCTLIYKREFLFEPSKAKQAVIEKYNWSEDAKVLTNIYNSN